MLDRLRLILAIASARAVALIIRLLGRGTGSVLPGSVARRIQPQALSLLARQFKHGIVLVAGTNGKTTTSLLLRSILARRGDRVAHNATGANLENGLTATLLADADWLGRTRSDVAILEVDENVLPLVLPQIRPRALLALNLFRDQLDRYGEVDTIARRWRGAIAPLTQATAILNADDPALAYFGQQLEETWGDLSRLRYFGLNEPDRLLPEIPHAVDSIYCPRCGHSLDYRGVYLSHLGDYHCPACGFERSRPLLNSADWPQILIGLYNKYNTLAAVTTAELLGVDEPTIRAAIGDFRAAFGRAEELTVGDRPVRILLSKNPVGLNETIRTIADLTRDRPRQPTVLLVLNDRTPDGTDVSWIWDADTEPLVQCGGTWVVSGDRVYDMALRLQYSQEAIAVAPGDEPPPAQGKLITEPDLKTAIATALSHLPEGETLYIVPTYSAMLEIRELLTGRAIL